jgi:cytochrome c oxidase subunit 1
MTANKLIKNWLILAVAALAGAGVYSLPPVVLRGPFFKEILPVENIFASSLVIHVNLSVLIWMLSIGGMLWSRFYNRNYHIFYTSAFYAAALGALLMTLSPLGGELNPLKNNYIPVLQNPLFFMGLGLFACGMFLQILLTLMAYKTMRQKALDYGLYIAAIVTFLAMVCFIIAAFLSETFNYENPIIFYENLFWGGGHVLQFSYTILLVIAWFILLKASGYKNPLNKRFLYIIFTVTLLTALPAPFFYMFTDNVTLFTEHMRILLGFLPVVATISIIHALVCQKSVVLPQHIPITPQELVFDTSAFLPSEEIKSLKYRHIPADLISSDGKKSSVKNQLLRRERYSGVPKKSSVINCGKTGFTNSVLPN